MSCRSNFHNWVNPHTYIHIQRRNSSESDASVHGWMYNWSDGGASTLSRVLKGQTRRKGHLCAAAPHKATVQMRDLNCKLHSVMWQSAHHSHTSIFQAPTWSDAFAAGCHAPRQLACGFSLSDNERVISQTLCTSTHSTRSRCAAERHEWRSLTPTWFIYVNEHGDLSCFWATWMTTLRYAHCAGLEDLFIY